MLGECDNAKAGLDIPDLYFSIIRGSNNLLPVWGVGKSVHRIQVTLLLQDIGL